MLYSKQEAGSGQSTTVSTDRVLAKMLRILIVTRIAVLGGVSILPASTIEKKGAQLIEPGELDKVSSEPRRAEDRTTS